MAAGQWTLFSHAMLNEATKKIDYSADTFVVVLMAAAFVPDYTANAVWSDISASELSASGTGYTAGGQALTVTATLTGDTLAIAYSNAPDWAALAATFRYGTIVRRAGASLVGTDPLIAGCDLGGGANLTVNGEYKIDASGIVNRTHTP